MEVLEKVGPYLSDCSNFLTSHPVLAVLGAGVGCLLLLRLYTKLSIGICDCNTSMVGKTVIITGANSGIGKETARELAKRGAKVILACRNRERGEKAMIEIIKSTGNEDIILKELDLSSFDSVRKFAKDILNTEQHLDVLINNAGILSSTETQITADGCEVVMQSNHLGHFLLTHLLLDLMKQNVPRRIINVSSIAYKWGVSDWSECHGDSNYFGLQKYFNSKLANVHFTRELAKRLEGTGVTVNCLHPGVVKTGMIRSTDALKLHERLLFFIFGKVVTIKTALEGAQTTLHLVLCKDLEKVTGKFFVDCKEYKLDKVALDQESSRTLWSFSKSAVSL